MALLINENSDPLEPDDVELYSSWAEAARDYESWYAAEPHLVIQDDGRTFQMKKLASGRLTFTGTGETVSPAKLRELALRSLTESEASEWGSDPIGYPEIQVFLTRIIKARKH